MCCKSERQQKINEISVENKNNHARALQNDNRICYIKDICYAGLGFNVKLFARLGFNAKLFAGPSFSVILVKSSVFCLPNNRMHLVSKNGTDRLELPSDLHSSTRAFAPAFLFFIYLLAF